MKSNNATQGGGIYARHAVVDLEDSLVMDNLAAQNGGGIYIDAQSAGDFRFNLIGQIGNSTFERNTAQIGGEEEHLQVEKILACIKCRRVF